MCYSRILIDKLEISALTLGLNLQTTWNSLQVQMPMLVAALLYCVKENKGLSLEFIKIT